MALGPRKNKYRIGNRATEVVVETDPNTPTFPTTINPAGDSLFDYLVAIDATITAFVEEPDAIYVDGTNGNDANNGGELTPVATITQAIVLATAAGGTGRIIVAQGTYGEGDLNLTDGWTLEGRSLNTIIAGVVASVNIITLAGATGNMIKNITIQPAAAAAALANMINCTGGGTYDLLDMQIIAPAAALATSGLTVVGGSAVRVFRSIINTGAAGHTGIPINIGVAGSGVLLSDVDVTGNTRCTVDVGALTMWNSRVTNNNVAATEGVIDLSNAANLSVYNSVINNVNPGAGPNGYAINWLDATACVVTLNNAKLQNNGTYAAAAVTIIPESAPGGAIIINDLGFYAPPADINAAAGGLDSLENGLAPKVFGGINNPGWAGLGGGISPLAGGDVYDQWTYIMRIARALDALINTVATGVNAGAGVALGAYTGAQIP